MVRSRCLAVAAFAAVAPSVQSAQTIDTASVFATFRDANTACTADAGMLWGRTLCGPLALVERQTRLVMANDSAFGRPHVLWAGYYLTTAPAGVGFANTSLEWNGRSWAMVMLPLPTDRFDRVALVMHEVFHREQRALGLAAEDAPNNQLDELEGRRWLRLELNALASGLDALARGDSDVRRHAESALLFRAQRRALYPHADSLEHLLEIQEGLAEYTGDRLAMTLTGGSSARIANRVREFQTTPSYVRSFAYATGPAFGLLLDFFAPTWKRQNLQKNDPGDLLAVALKFAVPRNLSRAATARSALYGGQEIAREEMRRDSLRQPVMALYRQSLVIGPTVTLRQSALSRSFDPSTLVGFDMLSTVYPTGTFTAEWGTLDVARNGALVSNDYRWLRVVGGAIPTAALDGPVVRGAGWVLTLKPGWTLREITNGPGHFEVVRKVPE